jgi:hypothetical protein
VRFRGRKRNKQRQENKKIYVGFEVNIAVNVKRRLTIILDTAS